MVSKLYKYKAYDKYSLDGLKKNKIWYSNPKEFNDIFDTYIRLEQLRKEIQYEEFKSDDNNKNLNKVLNSNTIILSLTKNEKSNLMWAHYAGYHKGFCLEFDFLKEESYYEDYNSIIGENCRAIEVKYDKPYLITKLDLIDSNKAPIRVFCNKSEEWHYEKEYRLIMSMKSSETLIIRAMLQVCQDMFKGTNDVVVCLYSEIYKELSVLNKEIHSNYFSSSIKSIKDTIKHINNLIEQSDSKINTTVIKTLSDRLKKEIDSEINGSLVDYPSKLTGIIFGYKMPLEHKLEIRNILRESYLYDVEYKKISASEKSFELNIECETFEK